MVEMPESSRFAAKELGLGGGAGLEGRAKLMVGMRDLDSDAGEGGGGPGAGETMEDRPVGGRRRWDADESTPTGGLRVGEPPRSRSSASQALREGKVDAWDRRGGRTMALDG